MSFFEWGLAELSGVPHHRTWLMVHDAGDWACRPSTSALACRRGCCRRSAPRSTPTTLDFDGGPGDMARFQRRMLQRFLTQPQAISREDVDYLLDKIDRLTAQDAIDADVDHATAA